MDYLNACGIQASITNADRAFGKGGGVRQSKVPKGHPDITCVLDVLVGDMPIGLGWYIEVKTKTGSVKPEQRAKLTSLANAGALSTLARDVDTVIRVVEGLRGKQWTKELKANYDLILDLNLNHRKTKEVRERLENLEFRKCESH
jgi:hypothetical protein